MLYMYVQRLVSFKFQRPQITVVTNHHCYDTVTLNPNNETELHGIAVVFIMWRVDCVTRRVCDELTGAELIVWRHDRVTRWPCDELTGSLMKPDVEWK